MLQPKPRLDPVMVLGILAILLIVLAAACVRVDQDDSGPCDGLGLSAVEKPVPPPARPAAPVKPAAPAAPPRLSLTKAPAAPAPRWTPWHPVRTSTATVTATATARQGTHRHVDFDCD
ncbi:hypothetical protein [Streptomyces sp. NPDC088847]|uniref:hypothetical protein n=1 Tax=Streptomyces sp. NPDC088847 TaxID=3365909 RepID=UPI00381D3CD6